MKNKILLALLALTALTGRSLGAANVTGNATAPVPPAVFQVANLTFDHAVLISMINAANQSNGELTNFVAGLNAGVVSLKIVNVGKTAGICYLQPIIRQEGNSPFCQGTLVTGPILYTKTEVQPGQTFIGNLANIGVLSGQQYSGNICQDLQNTISNNFGGGNNGNNGGSGSSGGSALAAVGSTVNELNQMQLMVCLEASANSGMSPETSQVCTPFSIFAQPPSVLTSSSMLVYPNHTSVSTAVPSFVWTPTLYKGSSVGISYELVLSQTENGNPWYAVQIPAGQTYYQYQASDRTLEAGQQYYWHVVSFLGSQPVGGQGGQGWAQPQATFGYTPLGATGAGAALVTLPELNTLVQQNASPAVLKALAGMQIQSATPMGALSDPDVAALVAKPTEIKSISVLKF